MESIQNTLQKINSEEFQKTLQTTQTSSDEISIYQGCGLSEKAIIEATEKILTAFPKMEPQMIKLLKERFKANGFNDERMLDAVNYVIDNYRGYDKLPSIADFISYDKKIKTYTGKELMEKYKDSYYYGASYDPIANEYELIDVNGEPKYVKKEEAVLWKKRRKK